MNQILVTGEEVKKQKETKYKNRLNKTRSFIEIKNTMLYNNRNKGKEEVNKKWKQEEQKNKVYH